MIGMAEAAAFRVGRKKSYIVLQVEEKRSTAIKKSQYLSNSVFITLFSQPLFRGIASHHQLLSHGGAKSNFCVDGFWEKSSRQCCKAENDHTLCNGRKNHSAKPMELAYNFCCMTLRTVVTHRLGRKKS